MAESLFSNKSDAAANMQIESHLLAGMSKLGDTFTGLLPVSEWPQEPHEIEVFQTNWSSIALTPKKQ
jgi:hypothetical protein